MFAMDSVQQWLWALTILFSAIFVLQTLLALIGLNADGFSADMPADLPSDVSADVPSDIPDIDAASGFELWNVVSVRTLLAFFFGSSWTAVLSYSPDNYWWVFFAVNVGFVFATVSVFLMRSAKQMEQKGNIDLQQAIGLQGVVSIGIGGGGSSQGKITLQLQGRELELLAATKDLGDLARGKRVEVLSLQDNVLIVTAL